MSKEIFTIFDFETTGLNDPVGSDQIIEVAALRTDLKQDYGTFQTYVRLEKGRTLSDFIKNLTGITEGNLENGLSEFTAIEMLRTFGSGTTFVAHHYPFDASFFRGFYHRPDPEIFICTRVLVKLVEPDKSASLKDVADRLGIDLTGHHRATHDVVATKAILSHYLPLAEAAGIEYRNVLINDSERPLKYIPTYAKVINK
jgi:DNA polymerase III subunit epsilon